MSWILDRPLLAAAVLSVVSAAAIGQHASIEIAPAPGVPPHVVVMTARPERPDEHRVLADGAVGYLPKPLSFRDIVGALRRVEGKQTAAPRVRALRPA